MGDAGSRAASGRGALILLTVAGALLTDEAGVGGSCGWLTAASSGVPIPLLTIFSCRK